MPTPDQQIQAAVEAAAALPALSQVFLVACGGSLSIMEPARFVLDRESQALAAVTCTAAEFVQRAPRRLGPGSLVILASHSGKTPETVEAARFARARGALTIALSTDIAAPLAQAVDHAIQNSHQPLAGDPTSAAALLLRLVFGILQARERNPRHDAFVRALDTLGPAVAAAQQAHAERIRAFGASHKREPVIYTMASGPNYGTAYAFAICILQEMQWIHSQAIHAGEYFHGPFEITDTDVPFIVLMGLGETRAQDERALAFAKGFSQRLTVLDARDFDLTGTAPEIRDYLTPLLFGPLLRAYAVRLAEDRGHPLTVRRYMWKMDY